jgi:hypothetical protein
MADQYPPVAKISPDKDAPLFEVNPEWWELVRDEYLDFESFKEYFRKESAPDRIVSFELEDGMRALLENPPEEWLEEDNDFFEDFVVGTISRMIGEYALAHLAMEEHSEIGELLDECKYKIAIIRESAFMEEFLAVQCMVELRNRKMEDMSNKDLKLIEQMGHTDRIRLARLLRIVDETQHGYLQRMANLRNDLAHTPWGSFDGEIEDDVRDIANKVHSTLPDLAGEGKIEFYRHGRAE